MQQHIITISREFGSGGRIVAEELAKRLGIKLYDRTLIDLMATQSGLPRKLIEENDQRITNSLLFQVAVTGALPPWLSGDIANSPEKDLFSVQRHVILDIAKNGSCVILGRCANDILRNTPHMLSVFLYGGQEKKSMRCISQYDIHPSAVLEMMKRKDKERAEHYKYFTGQTWGKAENYHLCINTDVFEIDGTVQLILDAMARRENQC